MNRVLAEIFETRQIACRDGSTVPCDVSISLEEGLALQAAIRDVKPAVTLEVGLARGVSSVFMCEALAEVGGTRHIVIDPGPVAGWNDVGLYTIERAGYASLVDFHNEPSHRALPRLELAGERVGVALIDGWHTFDYVLVDFFYVDRLLDAGGIVVFDDTRWYPAIRKVARYVATHRRYSALEEKHAAPPGRSIGRRLLDAFGAVARARAIQRLTKHVVRPDVLVPDASLGLPPHNHIAFRKLADDILGDGRGGTRRWDQHDDF